MIVVKMVKRPASMFWLCAAAIARVASSQSSSNVMSVDSMGTLSSSVAEAAQTHTVSVGKVSAESIARHHISMNLKKQLFLTNARGIISTLQTSYKRRLAMSLVS